VGPHIALELHDVCRNHGGHAARHQQAVLDTRAAARELSELMRDPQHSGQLGARAEEEVLEDLALDLL